MEGRKLTIKWKTGDGSGDYIIQLNNDCISGAGENRVLNGSSFPALFTRNTYDAIKAESSTTRGCTLASVWAGQVSDGGSSTWIISADGTAVEEGLDNARGRATMEGRKLTILWDTGRGSGDYVIQLNNDCTTGSGVVRGSPTSNPPWQRRATFTRITYEATKTASRATRGCTLASVWAGQVADGGRSTWIISADGTAVEEGLGNARGRAILEDHKLTIVWDTGAGNGDYVIQLNGDCSSGRGEVRFNGSVPVHTIATVFTRQ
jgi:hypothetical protein